MSEASCLKALQESFLMYQIFSREPWCLRLGLRHPRQGAQPWPVVWTSSTPGPSLRAQRVQPRHRRHLSQLRPGFECRHQHGRRLVHVGQEPIEFFRPRWLQRPIFPSQSQPRRSSQRSQSWHRTHRRPLQALGLSGREHFPESNPCPRARRSCGYSVLLPSLAVFDVKLDHNNNSPVQLLPVSNI